MIERLTAADRQALFDYIDAEPEMTLFFRGDVENEGFDSPQVAVYADRQPQGFGCVLLDYRGNWSVYSRDADGYDVQAAAGLIRTHDAGHPIAGKEEVIRRLQPLFPQRCIQTTHMSRCTALKTGFDVSDGAEVRLLTEDDVPAAIDLYDTIEEFDMHYADADTRNGMIVLRRQALARGEYMMGVFAAGRLAAISCATACYSQGAMVVGVATAKDCRNRGYASAAMTALIRLLMAQGRGVICLFYDNPKAASIYHRLGFEDVGNYVMLKKVHTDEH